MIKLVVTDIDGTLVKDGSGTCNPEYFPVIEELEEKGCQFVAASGRQYISLNKMFAPVAEQIYYISESGGILWHGKTPEVLEPIPYELAQEFADDVQKLKNVDLMVSGPENSYVPIAESRMHRWVRDSYGYQVILMDHWKMPKQEQIVKIALYHPDHIEEALEDWFMKKWNQKLHMCLAGTMWMDCVMPGINKGEALKLIQQKLHITKEETVVFADNQNDIEMLLQAGTACAVKTARQEVKDAATKTIPSYDEDGVLQELRKIVREL